MEDKTKLFEIKTIYYDTYYMKSKSNITCLKWKPNIWSILHEMETKCYDKYYMKSKPSTICLK